MERPRRDTSSIAQLKREHLELQAELTSLLHTDLADLGSDETRLRNLSVKVKLICSTFVTTSRKLPTRLIDDACVYDSQQIRNFRTNLVDDVRETLASINVLLRDLGY